MSSWLRVVGVGLVAIFVTALVGGVWSVLLGVNLATSPAVPWSVVVMTALLAFGWQVLDGRSGPRWGADVRHRLLRAHPLRPETMGWSLLAGFLSLTALIGLWIVLVQVSGTGGRSLPDYSPYPPIMVALALLMAAVLGAIVEEAMFRGYFQGALEHRLVARGWLAIVITGMIIAPEHALTQGFLWTTILFYLAVDVMLGALAYLTNSILPGIIVHGIGLIAFFGPIWPGDAGRRSIADGGGDATFWLHLAQVVLFTSFAIVAFRRLGRASRAEIDALQVVGSTIG